ncbi:hypothetical protein CL620_00900 [archaeon]|jgi:FkbM family methyltransferase|nr:hypothetical protein [archaeon]|tara:strand:+ start:653 stop:1324 length:672 start_codon:yes stop_codon:yes gene_type:complete
MMVSDCMMMYPEATGAYLCEAFTRHIDRDGVSTILELGSRNGMDALALADYYDANVYAFECRPDAISECEFNTRDDPRISVIGKAVWNEDSQIEFYPVVNGNDGASSCFIANSDYPYERYEQEFITVDAIRLDRWLANCGVEVDMVCMDLQGAECAAMLGMGDYLSDVKYVISEVQKNPLYKDTPLMGDLESLLAGHQLYFKEYVPVNDWFGDALFVSVFYEE